MPVNAPRMGQHMPAPHHRSMHSPPAGSLRPAGLRRLPRGLVSSPRLHAERRRARQMSQFTLKKILSQGVCYLLVQTLHNRFLSTGTRRLCPQPTGEEGRAAPCCAPPPGGGAETHRARPGQRKQRWPRGRRQNCTWRSPEPGTEVSNRDIDSSPRRDSGIFQACDAQTCMSDRQRGVMGG